MLRKHDRDDFLTEKPYKGTSNDIAMCAHLFPIDETEEFHDPFSDLSLFLAKKIKQEMSRGSSPQKWSRNIQTDLLKNILPDFKKRFPKYRLGHTALKKTWDKVLYYLQFIQKQKEAVTAEGKLNVDFLIQQNLKALLQNSSDLHPYTTAHNLAVKISECVATIDGERANLEEITKTIWAIQKHLIPKSPNPSPFERYDALDKLIVRFQLEEIAKHPHLSPTTVATATIKKVETLKQLQKIRHIEIFLSATVSENFYPALKLHKRLSSAEMQEVTQFIRKQLTEQNTQGLLTEEKDSYHAIQKLLFLYKLAANLTLEETRHNLETAVEYVYNLSQSTFAPTHPTLRPEVYAFIDAEISSLKERKVEKPLEQVLTTLMNCFSEAKALPQIDEELFEEVEMLAWKILQEIRPFSLPVYLKEALSEEIANISLDHPKESLHKILPITLGYLKKLHTLDTTLLEKKATFWSLQNDMLCKFLHFDDNTPLLKLMARVWKSFETERLSHEEFIDKVLAIYLKNNTSLTPWRTVLRTRVAIMYKYFWYNTLSTPSETSYDRFLKWHMYALLSQNEKEFPELLVTRIEATTKALVPLAPFSHKHLRTLV